jgi:NitT/TauT family transport system substrate-binding protein
MREDEMMRNNARVRVLVVRLATAVSALILFSAASIAQTGKPEKPNITFGVLPVTNYAVVYLTLKEGYFQQEGLNVTPRMMGGASPVAALFGGDFDIAGITWTAFLLAYNRGLELVPVSEADRGVPGIAAYLVKADSPIKNVADLLGKKVGVVTVGGLCDYLLNGDLQRKGLDYKAVSYTPIGVPDMAPTLLRGGLDAACVPEPFLTALKARGGFRSIMDIFTGEYENLPIAGFSVTAKFAQANPNTVAALRRALSKGLKLANENPDKIRETFPTYTALRFEDAGRIGISYTPRESDFTQVKRIADLMDRLKVFPTKVNVPPAIQRR